MVGGVVQCIVGCSASSLACIQHMPVVTLLPPLPSSCISKKDVSTHYHVSFWRAKPSFFLPPLLRTARLVNEQEREYFKWNRKCQGRSWQFFLSNTSKVLLANHLTAPSISWPEYNVWIYKQRVCDFLSLRFLSVTTPLLSSRACVCIFYSDL